MNKPNLYIMYFKNGEPVKLGPFYTAAFDGGHFDKNYGWVRYRVQEPGRNVERTILVPWYHSFYGIIPAEGGTP